ncbi:MAG: 2'-5' RNA ligase family protein [Propionibacteriaceae bacterium]
MTQSVELLLDPVSETAVRDEWVALHQAGLPTELRAQSDGSHRPHLTLFAGAVITDPMDRELSDALTGLDLRCRLGAVMLFGPHRDRYVLVHSVVPTAELLEVQRVVAGVCGAESDGHFSAGGWTPHVTVARRLPREQVPDALLVLASSAAVGHPVRIDSCRRWDGTAKRTWLL